MKKLILTVVISLFYLNSNSQTKLFNDDGTYRTDGIYYINVENYITVDRKNTTTPYVRSQNYYLPIVFEKKINPEYLKNLINYSDLNYSIKIFYKDLTYTNEQTSYWNNIEQMKYDILNIKNSAKKIRASMVHRVSNNYFFFKPYTAGFANEHPLLQCFNFYEDKVIYKAFKNINYGEIGNLLTSSENKLNFIEVYEMKDEYIQKQISEAKRIQDEKDRVNAIEQQKVEQLNNQRRIEFEKSRKLNLKSVTIGDRICYSQDWTYTKSEKAIFIFGATTQVINYKMMVICYVERIEGSKMQVRVANVESSNNTKYSTPDYKGVKMTEGSIHWVNPYTDTNWLFCE
jgi:hypothetical protein